MTTESNEQNTENTRKEIVIIPSKSNDIGLIGFCISLLALFLFWFPIFGWPLWVVGLALSFIGVFKEPRGFSIAGLVISFVGLIMLILFITVLAVALSEYGID